MDVSLTYWMPKSTPFAFWAASFRLDTTMRVMVPSGRRSTRSPGNSVPANSRAKTASRNADCTTPVRSICQRSVEMVRPGINFGVQTNPPLKVSESSGARLGLLWMRVVVSGSKAPPFMGSCDGWMSEMGAEYNSSSAGSRKPSPQVNLSVSDSSSGCQRTPTFGTATAVLLLRQFPELPAARRGVVQELAEDSAVVVVWGGFFFRCSPRKSPPPGKPIPPRRQGEEVG